VRFKLLGLVPVVSILAWAELIDKLPVDSNMPWNASVGLATAIFTQGLFKACPLIERAGCLGKKFKQMAKNRQANQLDEWMKEAIDSEIEALKNFTKGLKQNYDAVKAALTYDWSNGPVERHINRLKTIKRQMYGRAGFSLLKKRVLLNTG
jgi:hypothetical protein